MKHLPVEGIDDRLRSFSWDCIEEADRKHLDDVLLQQIELDSALQPYDDPEEADW